MWRAERIRGELLKLGLHVCKRTIQKYMRHARSPRQGGQNWTTFLQNHAKDMWACDFLQVTDLFFHSLFTFFIIDMQSRRVIHVGVTRSPTDTWAAQQLREATPYIEVFSFLPENSSWFEAVISLRPGFVLLIQVSIRNQMILPTSDVRRLASVNVLFCRHKVNHIYTALARS
jgi:hypothetical protein